MSYHFTSANIYGGARGFSERRNWTFFPSEKRRKTEFDAKNKASESEFGKKCRNRSGSVGIGVSENRNFTKTFVGMSESMNPPGPPPYRGSSDRDHSIPAFDIF